MEIDEIDDKDGHVYRLKKIDEIQEILIAERYKRNALSTSYNKGVNVISVIDNCLVVAAYRFRYNWSWSSLNKCCCTSRYWNGSSTNCYGFTSSCRKSSN